MKPMQICMCEVLLRHTASKSESLGKRIVASISIERLDKKFLKHITWFRVHIITLDLVDYKSWT